MARTREMPHFRSRNISGSRPPEVGGALRTLDGEGENAICKPEISRAPGGGTAVDALETGNGKWISLRERSRGADGIGSGYSKSENPQSGSRKNEGG